MRTSDARYLAVQRRKRPPYDYVPLVQALREARSDPRDLSGLDEIVRDSASEFTHVLLATGKTAYDFRQNFRHGAHGANLIECNILAGMDALRAEKLDGFVVIRLSKEQTKNVKLRWAKLRDQDRLLHDPQGTTWMGLMRCWLNAVGEAGVIERLVALREQGEQLTAKAAISGSQEGLERASKELLRYVRSADYVEKLDWDEAKIHQIGRDSFFSARRIYREGFRLNPPNGHKSVDCWRREIEESLVVAEAYLNGGDVKTATADPDTSKRHSTIAQLQARFDRIDKAVGDQWRAERRAERAAKGGRVP